MMITFSDRNIQVKTGTTSRASYLTVSYDFELKVGKMISESAW